MQTLKSEFQNGSFHLQMGFPFQHEISHFIRIGKISSFSIFQDFPVCADICKQQQRSLRTRSTDSEIRMDDGVLHNDFSEQNRSWDESGTAISDT